MHNTTLRIATAAAIASSLAAGGVSATAHAETTATVATNTGDNGAEVTVNVTANATPKSGFTQDEANALEVAGVVVGILAVLGALMAGWLYFAAPHMGLNFGPRL
ncbi:hypothetical protein [Corynebacterium sp. NML130628]|uniref:hypothetical protein n=1 Tax=Corynebacterium sp. NML130628 TaxID=1906333 RepID=UPI0008FBAC70|nr:hypothetical protein [Corynebacterium sp. NML130628]OIR40216.1 hypothetical protein BJP07_09645 [Corynebacterium sp. NML130628]